MSLLASISSFWCSFQEQLFPTIEEDLGPLGERYQSFIRSSSSSGWNNIWRVFGT